MTKYKYGWKRQLPDHRDLTFNASAAIATDFPRRADLTAVMPPVYDQGQLGSCTSNAIAGALEYLQTKENLKWKFTPSRLFIYYNERSMEGTTFYDSGAVIRDGIACVNKYGVCPEDGNSTWKWPYSDDGVRFRIKPFPPCYKDAVLHEAVKYSQVAQTEEDLKSAIVTGYPIIFGITVYDSFESQEVAKTGDVPMPGPKESTLGGHAILIVGYDDDKQRFIFRNSWGEDWGTWGYGTLPYAYVTNPNLASDFWVIQLVK